uniref:Uncharacterized protein n=1 Tax=Stegastes partitus TaxID=144197 RepID=A0A3B4ZLJ2_9TELE
MKLKRFLLRYYPPDFEILYFPCHYFLNYCRQSLVAQIRQSEPLVTESRAEQVKQLVLRLQQKQGQQNHHRFCFCKELKAHILPLTNVAFDKSGSRFITGSYDRTCRVWDTASGTELHMLEVCITICFNLNVFDYYSIYAHLYTEGPKANEAFKLHSLMVVCLAFNPQSTLVATGSMDTTAKLWDVENGEEVATLAGHTAEVLSLCFNTVGNQLVTGSFDHTVAVWDVASGRRVHTLIGHTGEISNVQFNWDCSLIVTGSMDKTCKLWEAGNGKCVATLVGHKEEVLDVCFDLSGQLIAAASADGTARVFSTTTHQCLVTLEGHDGEISKVTAPFACALNRIFPQITLLTSDKV